MLLFFHYLLLLLIPVSQNHDLADENDKKNNVVDFDTLLQSIDNSYKQINDYTCLLYKKELVQGKYIIRKNIIYKFKKPNNYYLHWTEGEDKGMEVIYAGKKYDNKLKVHTGGLFSFVDVAINPRGKMALKDCRHSILDSDIGSIINIFKKNYEMAIKQSGFEFYQLENVIVDEKIVPAFKIIFPKSKIYYGHIIYFYLDNKTNLPIKFVVYNNDNKLLEDYEFWDLQINAGLTDFDFDIENPKYNF